MSRYGIFQERKYFVLLANVLNITESWFYFRLVSFIHCLSFVDTVQYLFVDIMIFLGEKSHSILI